VSNDTTVPTNGNDWRVTVRLLDDAQASTAAASLRTYDVEAEARRRLGAKVMVGTDGGSNLFLYTATREAANAAQESVSGLLSGHGVHAEYSCERWHPVAERWEAADVALPATAAQVAAEREQLDAEETQESLAAGIAMFEVRVQLPSHHDAVALARRLQAEGYSVVRRWRFLVVGANNADQAAEFAAKVGSMVPPGGVVSTEEVGPDRPYTVFELAAGSGL
jgi:hypothetical protein